MTRIVDVLTETRWNTGLSWLLLGFLAVVIFESVVTGDVLWAGFTTVIAVVALLPSVVNRTWHVLVPWELVFLVALPTIGRAIQFSVFTNQVAVSFAIAGFALLVAVELAAFTDVEMTPGFAVFFVVVATLAISGFWTVAQWLSDLYLNTVFLPDHDGVMWRFVAVTGTGMVAGSIFQWYFQRHRAIKNWVREVVP